MTRFTLMSLSLTAVSVLALGSAACESETKPPPQAPQTTAGAPSMPAGSTTGVTTTGTTAGGFTVGDTFGVLGAIHAAEVEHGSLAMQKGSDPKVKSYAEKVVTDHKTRMARDEKLLSGLGVAPQETAVSQQIKSASSQQTERLNALSGSAFDRAYIEEQVNYYRTALDVFDNNLLPNARDPQIRADIAEARARANEHLKEAQDIRLTLINK